MLDQIAQFAAKGRKLISPRFVTSIWLFLYLLVIYFLLRLTFLIVNYSFLNESTTGEIFRAFFYGLRFDIAAILMLNLPVLILFHLPIRFSIIKFASGFLFILFCFLNLIGITLNIADLGYYPTIQRRLLFEPYTALGDTIRMLPSLFKNYAPLMIGFLFSSFLFVYLTLKLVRKITGKNSDSFSYTNSIITFILIILLSIIGIRGGVQLKPIRQTNAFFSDNRPLGYLVLNSTYTVLRSYFQYTFPNYNFYSKEESGKIIQEMIKSDDETMLDPAYPFLRKKTPAEPFLKKNVIIFIMESWSAEYVGSITGWNSDTPFFDSLAKEGLLFTNFLASGQRSIEAVPSILASLPAMFPSSIIGSRAEINKIRGLGSILREHGYTTSFHHGASQGSMGFDAFVPSAGFINYYGKESFENYADSLYDGVWGIFDEPFFLDAARKMGNFQQPFCSVIFSLSSHDPFKIPKYRQKLFTQFKSETDFQLAIRYSDYSLGLFFEYAKKQSWFKNTVFVITGDHTLYTSRNDVFSNFHVPLLIYAPDLVKPKVETKVGSHVDIVPTILDLLHVPTIHASMGKSLLDESKEGFAGSTFYPIFLFFTNGSLYVDDFEKKRQYFPDFKKTSVKDNLFSGNIQASDNAQRKLKAYIQDASRAVNEDLIYKK